MKFGQGTGKAAPQDVGAQGLAGGAPDHQSALPRLMPLPLAAWYIGVSVPTLRELINAGSIPVVRIERPRTPQALRPRARKAGAAKQAPSGGALRMLRLDRADLDRFVAESCEHLRLVLPWSDDA